ncbi:AAA family ATPase [Thomasclavelia saccharogumia]|uniref:AAA family ATPase n=1 Tax=Thomasclavelia saccharogumia TaxID=341225 RepID=UPI00047DE63C|nr:AAA family ATPase [Thomasclavelia saccharogumia]
MKGLLIGIENFKKLIDKNVYYVDKSKLIEDLINEEVILYTRPRRFGKTLNMSMLYYFFSIKQKENAYLFDNLEISKNIEVMKHQNQYPVIFITLKDMKSKRFNDQIAIFSKIVRNLINDNLELLNSDYLEEIDKDNLVKYQKETKNEIDLQDALNFISKCLKKHYHQNVIILIDEYDVPLQSAYINGYYDEMVEFLRNIFSTALKTNDSLERGVLTGCLQIAKESIFTGLNNFSVRSILNQYSSDCFGFEQNEIDELLKYYDLYDKKGYIKEWYDGYRFYDKEIYNPWSTLLYVKELLGDRNIAAIPFWANTSSNDIVYKYIIEGNQKLKDEFDLLINGESIEKIIKPELTYREMDDINNIYSFLLFTGYLKIIKYVDINCYRLMIPNKEIKLIYTNVFQEWANKIQENYGQKLIDALLDKDENKANEILNYILLQSMSYHDGKESFYHGFILGLLNNNNLFSNIESGDGRSDIKYLPVNKEKRGFILELKICKNKDLYDTAIEACNQIIEKRYLESDKGRGYLNMLGYGIAFDKKRAFIKMLKVS